MTITNYNRCGTERVVFLSDIHMGVKNASIEWLDNICDYFNNFFIPLIEKYIKREKCILVIAGDFFDNRQSIDINVLNRGMDIIESLSSRLEVFLMIGNHDIYKKKDTDTTSLRVFTHIDNVHVLYNTTTVDIGPEYNTKKMLLIPWVGDPKEENKILSSFAGDNIDIAVLHSDICGLRYDNGREILNGVNISSFSGTKIYSGHIHKRQSTEKVTYFGSPYQMRRSDIGNVKGVYSLQCSQEGELTEYFVENLYSPQFLRLPLESILDMTTEQLKKIICNNYVDILIKQKYINEINVSKIIEIADECNVKKIEIILDKSDSVLTEDDNTVKTNEMTIEEIFISKINKMDSLTKEDIDTLEKLNQSYIGIATGELNLNI